MNEKLRKARESVEAVLREQEGKRVTLEQAREQVNKFQRASVRKQQNKETKP